jgi:hypothetical protein
MTKEEILNGMSEQEFYDMYPDQESWENAQQMKLGGLSGAPHDGQPTADQFFNYGSHANDAVNVPMSNPFFAANGGTPYYGGPIRPYQTGGYKPAPNPDTYFNEQDAALDYPSKGSNRSIDYSKVTKQGPTLSQYSTSELNKMGANIPVPNPTQDARFAKIAAYNKEHPYIPAGGNLFKRPDGSADRFNYTNGAYTPYKAPSSQPLVNNRYGGYMDMGGNMASPMNYGAFSVPMQYGGDELEYGGVLDPGNNQDYPILEEGGKSTLMAMIKAHSKKMRKAYKDGGDTVMQGGNSDDYPTNLTNTFKNVLKQNMYNHMINEEEKNFSNEMMQVGGFAGGPGMNYNNTTFSQPNQQNQALAGMYQQRIDATKDNLSNDFSNLGNATKYLGATANPYKKTGVKLEYGGNLYRAQEGWEFSQEHLKKQKRKQLMDAMRDKMGIALNNDMSDQDLEDLARKEGLITDKTATTSTNTDKTTKTTKTTNDDSNDSGTSDYNKYFSQDKKNYYFGQNQTQGTNNFPMNYNPYTKISKTDVAKLKQLAATPTSGWQLKEFNHRHFGPWGKTKMKFGYRDETPYTENKADPAQVDLKKKPVDDSNFQEEAMSDVLINQSGPRSYNDFKEKDPMQGFIPKRIMLDSIFNDINNPKSSQQGSTSIDQSKIISKPDEAAQRKQEQLNDKKELKPGMPEYDNRNSAENNIEKERYGGILKRYKGLAKAQYGRDQKSTNPADGTYDNFGNPIGLSSATGNMGLASSNMLNNTFEIGNSFQPAGNAQGAAPGAAPAAQGTKGPGAGVAAASISSAAANTKTPTPESVGLQQKNVEMKGMGTEKEATVTTKNRPGFDKEAMANWGIAGMNTISGILEQGQNAKNEKQLANLQLADNAFMATPANAQSRGDYDPNSGMFRMDQMTPVQFPGGMGYSAYGGSFQDGGMQEEMQPQQAQPEQGQQEQIMQGVASMLQQGAQPEQIAQQLVQMGIPQEQVMQIIQAVMQQMEGGQEEQPMQPAMRYGGYAMGGNYEEGEEADLSPDEIEELRSQGYDVEYLD